MSFLFGPPDVEKLKTKKDISGLIKALSYQKEARIREQAARALGQLRAGQAMPGLTDLLRDGDAQVREMAAWALGRLADQNAVQALRQTLKDSHQGVRLQAVMALEQIASPACVGALAEALLDGDRKVRQAAVEALAKVGDRRAVDPLVGALQDADPGVRLAAVKALGNLGDPRAAQMLVKALFEEEKPFADLAAEALVKIGAPAIEPLLAAFAAGGSQAAEKTGALLERLGWQPPKDAWGARYYIARGQWSKSAEMGAPAVPVLIEELSSSLSQSRQGAASALGGSGDGRAVEPLVNALQDSDRWVRTAAAQALIALYKNGSLQDAQRQRILENKAALSTHTDDHSDRRDAYSDCVNEHTDYTTPFKE